MRFFTAIATFGLVALVSAQSSVSSASPVASSTSGNAPASTSVSAEAQCLNKCAASDLCCQARCVGVPCPSQIQANSTTECAAQCPQGNGTEEETSSYASCQSSCISSLFFPTTASGAGATGAAGSSGSAATTTAAAGTGIGGSGSSASAAASGTEGSSASATGGSAGSSSTGNAAPNLKIGAGAGLFGLVLAGLAL